MRWLVPFVFFWASAAAAHDADVIYVTVQPGAAPDQLSLTATLTSASLALLAPLDADGDGLLSQEDLEARQKAIRLGFWEDAPLTAGGVPCEWLETRAVLREGFVELHAGARCGAGELRQDFKILRVLPANYRVVLGSQLDGEARGRGFAQGALSAIPIPRPPPAGSWDEARFQRALEAGLKRVQAVEVIAAVVGLMIVMGRWRRGKWAAAVLCVSAGLASGVAVPGSVTGWLLVLASLGAAVGRSSTGSDRPGGGVSEGRSSTVSDRPGGGGSEGRSSTGSDRPGGGDSEGRSSTPLRTGPDSPVAMISAAVMGFAIGARDGGGDWVTWAGLATGTVPPLFVLGPIPLALGIALSQRPRVLRVARFLPPLVVLGAVLFHAQQAA